MRLYLLRHGIAVARGTSGFARDADRPLTAKGKRKLRKIARAMKVLKISPDLVLSSPLARARQTAEIVAQAVRKGRQLRFSEVLTPGSSPEQLSSVLARLDPNPQSVLLVGHEPYLSGLAAWLASGRASLSLELKKGGLCSLQVDSLKGRGRAALEWLLTPKQMALISSSQKGKRVQ
jgi:phosphohistidine phosphatase